MAANNRALGLALFYSAPMIATVALALLSWMQPAIAAIACPSCFGFERLHGSIYVDPAMAESQRAIFTRSLAEGEEKVAPFFGDLREKPVVLACASQSCSHRIGERGALAVSYAHFGLRLSPFGLDPVIVAHERTHVEVHGRLGLVKFLAGALPAWFDEGLAVVVSDDPRYVASESATGCGKPVTIRPYTRAPHAACGVGWR